jgi:hypothetical protein
MSSAPLLWIDVEQFNRSPVQSKCFYFDESINIKKNCIFLIFDFGNEKKDEKLIIGEEYI